MFQQSFSAIMQICLILALNDLNKIAEFKNSYLCSLKPLVMKNILQFLVAALIVFSFSVNPSFGSGKGYNIPVHSITITKVDSSQAVATIQLINYDTSSGFKVDTINWAFIHDGFAFTGWNYNFCDFSTCYYAPNLPSGKTDYLPNKTNGVFKLTVDTFNKHAYSATMTIKVWGNRNVNNPDTITITIDATRLGINNQIVSPSALNLYPNPATNYLNIEASQIGFEPVRALIYNSLGKLVSEQAISSGTAKLPVYDLPKGVYILKMSNSNNREAVKQFVKE